MPQELTQVMSSLPLELSSRKMGMNARNSYQIKSSNPASSQQQTEVVSPAPNSVLASTPTPTIEELSLSLEAVTQKVTVIEGRMSILESSFQILIRKTAELMEELRLTHEQLATKTQDLMLLRMERDSTTTTTTAAATKLEEFDDDLKEEVECLRNMDIGER